MKGYDVLVDMDQTLIDAVHEGEPNYYASNGKEITYYLTNIGLNGSLFKTKHNIRVSIRPYAIEMVRSIIELNHNYILWSAGLYEYVHAVMEYFISVSGVTPSIIYTRFDMILLDGIRYKSMKSKGFMLDNVIIIDDNFNLIHPEERSRMINISPWFTGKVEDIELSYVIQSLIIYSDVSTLNQGRKTGKGFTIISF